MMDRGLPTFANVRSFAFQKNSVAGVDCTSVCTIEPLQQIVPADSPPLGSGLMHFLALGRLGETAKMGLEHFFADRTCDVPYRNVQ
jgi:hypothetical protein